MSLDNTLSRISAIQTQIAAINGDLTPPSAVTPAAGAVPADTAASPATPASFAGALTQAQGLTAGASGALTPGQAQFASRLAAQTGLNPQVIAAWLLAEESGGAAKTREDAHNNDWLNIGYTDGGTYGARDQIWADPNTAADATAGWLKGQNTVPGYGPASAGVRAVLATAGQSPEAQISALQRSGWASSGYPDLPGLYQQISR